MTAKLTKTAVAKKIETLSPEQELLLKQTYDQGLAIGRNVEPINKAAAIEVVNEFYARIGKPAPRILTFTSPMMCILAWGVLRSLLDKDQLRGQLGGQLRDQLGDQLGGQLGGQLRDQLGGQLRDQLGDQLGDQLRNSFGGQHWCAWEVFFKFCNQIGVRYTEEQVALLDLWVKQSRALHWWFPYEGIVLLSERHNVLHIDSDGRLHSESGPACAYTDGWGVWAWHGTRVSQQIIESPETITVKQIQDEQNAEVRRVMVERMGWTKFVELSKTRVLHEDTLLSRFPSLSPSALVDNDDPEALTYVEGLETARLLESDFLRDFEGRPVRFVELRCPSTGKQYIQRVAHNETRVYEAVGRAFGLTEQEYKSGRYFRQGDVLMWALDQEDERILQQHS